MMVVISPSAESDLSSISASIAVHRPRVAIQWLEEIKSVFQMLDAHPNVGEERLEFSIKNCRSFSFGKYVIFFRHMEHGIEVARVLHGSRDLTDI